MQEFMLIFRENGNFDFQPSPEQMQAIMTDWMNWMGGMAAQGKLANPGNRLSRSVGKTVRANDVVTDGPFSEIKEFINGYIIVSAHSIDEAVELAKGCPILQGHGSVEVRAVVQMNDNS